ncbi:MAG: hypothetical protein Q9227_006688 [Pyrenula ochraceoflavens]
MVLDALAALSLATAAVQFLEFGIKIISKSKEIYESADGLSADQVEQAAVSTRLLDLTKELLQAQHASAKAKKLSKAEESLRSIVGECATLADDFQGTLESVKITGRHRRWKSFRQALKSVWTKDGLEKRVRRLDRLRQEVILQLLVCVSQFPHSNRPYSKSQSEALIQSNEVVNAVGRAILLEIQRQNQSFRDEIKLLASQMRQQSRHDVKSRLGQTDAWKQSTDEFLLQHQQIIAGFLNHLSNDRDVEKLRNFQRKVLSSLHFEKIDDRENMIVDKLRTTLEWIFESPAEYLSQWSDFPTWLQGPESLYWVSGKLGSGKSTLVKAISSDDRTKRLLQSWSGKQQLLQGRFFFWAHGTDLQKSMLGLLRSILHDLLRQAPELIRNVCPTRWQFYDLELAHFPAWSNADLQWAVRSVIRECRGRACVSLFIDGLDEFFGDDDQRFELLDMLKDISSLSNVKICLSSRPWEIFREAFAQCPGLRLENLTRNDIMASIKKKLHENLKFRDLCQQSPKLSEQLVTEITERAKGVWLWVTLVVRELLKGLKNDDSMSILLQRLRQIPQELSILFQWMLQSIDRIYLPEALKIFKIVANATAGRTLMAMSFVFEENVDFALATTYTIVSAQQIKQRLDHAARQINLRCLGLVEVTERSTSRAYHPFSCQTVDFLHRTAGDFLQGAEIDRTVDIDRVASFDVERFMCNAIIAQVKMASTIDRDFSINFMHYAAILESRGSSSLMTLIDCIDGILRDRYCRDDAIDRRIPITGFSTACWQYPLLPLAVMYGLWQYPSRSLKLNPEIVKQQCNRPILDYALRRSVIPEDEVVSNLTWAINAQCQPKPDLVRLILEQGANPNAKCEESTVWRKFVLFCLNLGFHLLRLSEKERRPWIEATELLINYGAAATLKQNTVAPSESNGKTQANLETRRFWVCTNLAVVFGDAEAQRLDRLAEKVEWRTWWTRGWLRGLSPICTGKCCCIPRRQRRSGWARLKE